MNFTNKINLTFIALLLFAGNIQSQNTVIDSLNNELSNHPKKDSTRVNLLNDLADYSYKKQKEKAFDYLLEAESITKTIDFEKGRANSLYIRGLNQFHQSNYEQAIEFFNKALLLYEKLDLKKDVSDCYANMGKASFSNYDYNKAINYYKNSIRIDEKLGKTKSTAINLKNIGYCFTNLGNYEKAEEYLNYALDLNTEYNNRLEISSCYLNIGSLYLKRANYPVALEHYNTSLQISETIEDILGISRALNNIGIIYKNYKKYDKAIEHYEKSLRIQKRIGTKSNVSKALTNLGSVYFYKKEYKTALNYYTEALNISKAINAKLSISRNLNNIGNIYLELNRNITARQYYEEAKKLAVKIEYQLGLCNSYQGIAKSYANQKKYKKALVYAQKSEDLSNKLGVVYFQRDIYKLLAEIYQNTGKFEEAFTSHQQFKIFNDSLFNKENIEKIAQLENEYKYKKALDSAGIRELKLSKEVSSINTHLEKSQRNIFLTIISFLVTAIILGGIIFFLKWRNIKEKNQNILIEQKLLRSQMTPHFIFNSLSVLQGMILNKEEKKSISYLSKFSKLLRIVLENSRDKIVPLIQELDAIDNYMVMQNLDTDPPYDYSLVVDENINVNLFQIPPMLIQPFIENAIEHAFDVQKEHREIVIHLKFVTAKLICTITDNGLGIDAISNKSNVKKKSLATTITSERLLMLAKEFKVPGDITITDRKKYNKQGTLVTLVIPYKINEN